MKKILLALLIVSGGLLASKAGAQTATFTTASDTVYMTVVTSADSNDYITNITGSRLTIKWHVSALDPDFPASWIADTAFQICDDNLCRNNSGNDLWNPSLGSGPSLTAYYYANSAHDSTEAFGYFPNLTAAVSGTHWVNVTLTDFTSGSAGYSKTITFVVNHTALAVPNVNKATEVNMYPNPAHDELNVVYDPSADIKTIAVYSIIGKTMGVYKVSDPTGANLHIENIPSGIYFVRLMNSRGEAVVTRRFTKQ